MSVVGKIKSILKSKGYVIYTRPYELNIVGVRSRSVQSNAFDDEFFIFWHNEAGKVEVGQYKGTTDPGTYWLNNPIYTQGTAILKAGQYKNAYKIGLHKGVKPALIQVKPVTVIRDYDRNALLDWKNGIEDIGLFGINLHGPSGQGEQKTIDQDSAGCQVPANHNSQLFLVAAAERHRALYGNQFTYTLIDYRAAFRLGLRRASMAAFAIAGGIATYFKDDIKDYAKGEEL